MQEGGSEMAQSITYYQEPKVARWLFASPASAPFWLVLRVWLGYPWLPAGCGQHAAVRHGCAAAFLRRIEHAGGWLAPVIAIGEVAIGIGLIHGILTGVSAFFGATLNTSFGLAGVAGVNPLFLVV